ncbi:GNAT family N-acetyltransferase [Clostridium oryzae]|uniref:Putative acetyltransferase n=1 Tax=Clostridium oryzae TaxID=1450648 RepID=A0A1V4ITH5_9CLOT|nr:GNAT family N-acetyltransferase [Clostridium oryzae]OPJ63094.1 putative acetyltransferase [Clostridium oryzae]
MIRKMNVEDVSEVQNIDKLCFNIEKYRSFELLSCYANEGVSLVWEDNGKVAGYIFNHISGNFAWFGTFGVHPDFRGKNIGKKLIAETINMFHKDYNIKNISLVTMPYSAYNVGFYSNLGFMPRELSVTLCKVVSIPAVCNKNNFSLEIIDLQDTEKLNFLNNTAISICSSLYEGLNFTNELYTTLNANMGTGFILYGNNVPEGFGILRNKNVFGETNTELHLRLLVIKENVSDYKKALDCVFSHMENISASKDISKISVSINTAYYEIYKHLLSTHNFKIEMNSLNLSMGKDYLYTSAKGLILFKTAS